MTDAPSPWALMGEALRAAWDGEASVLHVRSDADPDDVLPAAWLLRGEEELPSLEREALERTRGRVLDVGAGGGAHTLALQRRGHHVTALERSAAAVKVLGARGAADARLGDVFDPPGEERWDTVLLLMNGTTLVGSGDGLVRLLRAVEGRLAAGGKVLLDSTDLREPDGTDRRADGRYVGQVQLQLSWRDRRSRPFAVLYADPDLLARAAARAGLQSRVVARAEAGAFLAELRRVGGAEG